MNYNEIMDTWAIIRRLSQVGLVHVTLDIFKTSVFGSSVGHQQGLEVVLEYLKFIENESH